MDNCITPPIPSPPAPCLNCRGGAASHCATNEDDGTCPLCGVSIMASRHRKATLAALVLTRVDEASQLLDCYTRLLNLDDPMRTLLVSRAIAALQTVLTLESKPDLPALRCAAYEMFDASDEEMPPSHR